MNFYTDSNYNGELWLRDAQNNVKTASVVLSAVFEKYKSGYDDFYYDLNYNIITRFDIFYDTIFIQTQHGYIFEKVKLQGSYIQPYSYFDLYNPLQSNNIDYWFDEISKKIYFCGFYDLDFNPSKQIYFEFFFKEFDMNNGKLKTIHNKKVNLVLTTSTGLLSSNGKKEDPKLTYNADTNVFNISFLIKNEDDQNGLISINLNTNDILELNSFIPYGDLDSDASSIDNFVYLSTPTPTPTPTTSVTPSQTPTITPSITPTRSQTPTQTPTPSYTPTITPTRTKTPTPTSSKTPTPTPTITPSFTPSGGNVVIKAIYASFE